MKVAVTIWQDRISPVFDGSRRLLITTVSQAGTDERAFLIFDPRRPAELARMLTDLGVTVLICGAISQRLADGVTAGGIALIPFITGEVDRVLSAYAQGDSLVPDFVMPGCRGPAAGQGRPAE